MPLSFFSDQVAVCVFLGQVVTAITVITIAILRYRSHTRALTRVAEQASHHGRRVRVQSSLKSGFTIEIDGDPRPSKQDVRVLFVPPLECEPQPEHADPSGQQPDHDALDGVAVPRVTDSPTDRGGKEPEDD